MVNTEISHDRQLPAANTYNADDTGQPADANTFIALYGSIGFHHNPRTQAAWPAASNLGLVFPTPLTRIIVKADGKAWLKASFEDDLTRCELEFFIVTSGVQHVAKELFDVHIDTEGQQRGMRLKNDVFAQIGGGGGGTLILSGARLEKVKDMLGDQAVEAYQISPSRVEELNNGQIPITRCLSMEIWPDVDCPSRFRLRVEVGKLSSIAGSLWPGMLVN